MRQAAAVVEFEPNKPVEVALLYPTGKFVDTAHGKRVMFSLVDGRVMFLDPGPAQKINKLGVKPREPFRITLVWSGKKTDQKEYVAELTLEAELKRAQSSSTAAGDGSSARRYQQTLDRREHAIGATVGEQGDGTLRVPGASVSAPAPVGRRDATTRDGAQQTSDSGNVSKTDLSVHQGWAQFLLSETNALIDVYAAAKTHAAAKGVSAEQVLELLRTAFSVGRSGGPDVA